jgi:hypothetical protein
MSIQLSQIDWGNDSAERDPNLLKYFVPPNDFDKAARLKKPIITGRKGAGKSALRSKLESDLGNDPKTILASVAPTYEVMQTIVHDKQVREAFGAEIFFTYVWLLHLYRTALIEVGRRLKGQFATDASALARELALKTGQTTPDFLESLKIVLERLKVKAGNLGELGLEVKDSLERAANIQALEFHILELAKSDYTFVFFADDLDLGWENTEVSNNLLLGLLSATNHIKSRHANLHTCIFLRDDMYRLLMQCTQHSDKYRDILQVRWEQIGLKKILLERINFFFTDQHMHPLLVNFNSVFPAAVGVKETMKWMYERTLGRPRELLQLARQYTEALDGDQPDSKVLRSVEENYSNWKLDDLCSEFRNQYPELKMTFDYWKTRYDRTKYHLTKEELRQRLEAILIEVSCQQPWFAYLVKSGDTDGFARILFDIGFIGDFIAGGDGGSRVVYSSAAAAHEPKLHEVQVHPCFRKAVRTVERIREKKSDAVVESGSSNTEEGEEDLGVVEQ